MRQSEERYISLLTDFGFKRIFGTALNKELLICFLNSLFNGKQVVKDVMYLNSEHVGDVYTDRKAIFRHHVQLCDTATHKVFYDKLEFIYVEIAKFDKSLEELETLYDKWLYVLKNLSKLDNRPKELRDRVFDRLFEESEIAKFTPLELREYEDSKKAYRDIKNSIDTAKREGIEEGMEKGIKKGIKQGMEKGIKQGIEIGQKKEHERLLNTARALFASGMSLEQVRNFTDLTESELKQLKL